MKQYEIYLVELEPTIGHEIQKTRPCVIVSPNEMNEHIETIIIAPMTTKSHKYPTRIEINFQNKTGWIVLDQIRTVDKRRLMNYRAASHAVSAFFQKLWWIHLFGLAGTNEGNCFRSFFCS